MKLIFIILYVCFVNSTIAQNLSEAEFKKINSDIRETISVILYDKNYSIIEEKFNLSQENSKLLERILKTFSQKELYDSKSDKFLLHHFQFTDKPNTLKVTIYLYRYIPSVNGENYERGDYDFIYIAEVSLKDGIPQYKNLQFLTNSNKINEWFIKRFKTYMPKTSLIHATYNFVPPPPPPPPITLK